MGFYSRHVFPRLCDWVMRDARFEPLRRSLLAQAKGDILEIGFGTGLNLEHYPEHVRRITAIDPGEGMSRLSRRRIASSPRTVDLRLLSVTARKGTTLGDQWVPLGRLQRELSYPHGSGQFAGSLCACVVTARLIRDESIGGLRP